MVIRKKKYRLLKKISSVNECGLQTLLKSALPRPQVKPIQGAPLPHKETFKSSKGYDIVPPERDFKVTQVATFLALIHLVLGVMEIQYFKGPRATFIHARYFLN